MAKPVLFYNPKPGYAFQPGDKLFFYTPGTTTKVNTYTTSLMNVANANPVVANASGYFSSDIYMTGATIKVVCASNGDTDPPTSPVWTVDNWTPQVYSPATNSISANYTVTTQDTGKLLLVDATSGNVTITLLPAATAGDGAVYSIKKIDSSTNTVTVQAYGSELINDTNTQLLPYKNYVLTIECTGTKYHLLVSQTALVNINDINANVIIGLNATPNATDYIKISNATTGNPPSIGVGGSSNVGMLFKDSNGNTTFTIKGIASQVNSFSVTPGVTGSNAAIGGVGEANSGLDIIDSNGNIIRKFNSVASAVNYGTLSNSITNTNPTFGVGGTDTDIGISLQPKGLGIIQLLGTSTGSAELRLFEQTSNGVTYIGHKCPASLASSISYTWPAAPATTGSVLSCTTGGVLAWNAGVCVQRVSTETGVVATGTTTMGGSPTSSGGDQYMSLSITPQNSSNVLVIQVVAFTTNSVGPQMVGSALCQDSTSTAVAAFNSYCSANGGSANIAFTHIMTAGTTSTTTFKVRIGRQTSSGTLTFNGVAGVVSAGGLMASSILITEWSS